MSILIKGIDMPKDTKFTEVSFYNRKGELLRTLFTGEQPRVIQINRPHGCLIDGDKLLNDLYENYEFGTEWMIKHAPTILESEE